jgi:hypothetical protein
MSKVRNLTEITALADQDLFYVVDFSEANGGRKITLENLKETMGLSLLDRKFLQYYNAASQTNNTTTFTDVSLPTNAFSLPGDKFTKASATQFQCDFTGYVKIAFKAHATTDVNDRSGVFRIAKNGTGFNYTRSYCYGKNVIDRTSTASGCFIFQCVPGDYFTLQFASAEGAVVTTLPTESAIFSIESFVVSS